MEVLVSFLGGDPDRPVVLGSLYNQTHPTPEPLPRSQTRSGLRTQSTPGGAGFNEITFEDAKGMERIYLRGHRDIEVISGREHATFVGANQTLAVKDDQRASIAGDQLTAVGRNHGLMVGGHQLENVAGNRGARVECSQLGIVEGDDVAEVDGVSVRAVRGDAVSHVAGHQSASVGGDSFVHVGSGASGRAGSLVAHVQGGSYLTAGEKIVIRAAGAKGEPGAAIVLECGTSTIEMTPDTIVLRADNVIVEGGKRTAVTGGDGRFDMNGANSELSNAEVKMRSTAGARLDLGDGATLGGARVSLTGPAGAARQEAERQNTAASKVTFALVHGKPRNAKPIAGTRYRVLVGDEPPQEGRTDADGKVSFHAPEDATAATVLAWAHETYPTLYPKSRGPLEWLIHLVPGQLPGAGDLRGARMRLRNLGYRPSTELYQPLDEATTQAVREFQQAYQFSMHTEQHKARHAKDDDKDEARLVSKRKLRPSGELDDHTKTALETICGK
jgi:type VI secretion system secreted protein VgrG